MTWIADVPLPYNTPLVVNVPAPVPPLLTGSIPETKVDEARLTGPDDNPPKELDWTIPDPKVEKTGADDTVKDEPIETLPVVDKVANEVWAATVKPDKPWIKELKMAVPPTPTLPVRSENPLTLNPPEANSSPVVVKDPPTPVLPDTVNELA